VGGRGLRGPPCLAQRQDPHRRASCANKDFRPLDLWRPDLQPLADRAAECVPGSGRCSATGTASRSGADLPNGCCIRRSVRHRIAKERRALRASMVRFAAPSRLHLGLPTIRIIAFLTFELLVVCQPIAVEKGPTREQLLAEAQTRLKSIDGTQDFAPAAFPGRWLADSGYVLLHTTKPKPVPELVRFDVKTGQRSVAIAAEQLTVPGTKEPLTVERFPSELVQSVLLANANRESAIRCQIG